MTLNSPNALDGGKKGQVVSVIIPTHNRPQFLKQSVASVLNQTHGAIEVIIVDDGSHSLHADALEQVASQSPRIRLVRQGSSKGPGYARNQGLKKATGDYLLFLDDDDLLGPGMVSDGLKYFRMHQGVDVVICAAMTSCPLSISSGDGTGPEAKSKSETLSTPMRTNTSIGFSEIQRISIPINACLVRRRGIGAVRFPEDLLIGEDTYFWLSLKHQGAIFHYYDSVNVHIRQHRHNTTRSKPRYHRLIQNYQNKLLNSGMLKQRRDIALTTVQRGYFKLRLNPAKGFLDCGPLLKYTDLIFKALSRFLFDRLRKRKRSFWRYF